MGQTIRLRFRFDSVDSASNEREGVYVDDLEFYVACPPLSCTSSTDCEDGNPCTSGDICISGYCKGTGMTNCDDDDVCTDDDGTGGVVPAERGGENPVLSIAFFQP